MKKARRNVRRVFCIKRYGKRANMKRTKRNRNRKGIVVDIVACALSAVSVAFSIAAFVISLVRKNSDWILENNAWLYASHCGILLKLSLRGETVELKSGLKRTKKVLDKRISVWYNKWAVSKEAAVRKVWFLKDLLQKLRKSFEKSSWQMKNSLI